MDEKDRDILRMLQDAFPLDPEPYRVLGDKLWIDEVTVISRVARLMQDGVIRHMGPFLNSRKLGYTGMLAAIDVPQERIDAAAAVINRFPGVTHNYVRGGTPNMWFTLLAPTTEACRQILETIRHETGVERVWEFPARRMFKVKVELD
jgi:siroheme decarboxylase